MTSTQQCPHSSDAVLDEAFVQDPHVRYAWMRANAPVRRVLTVTGLPVWLVTRYADSKSALNDARLSKDYRRMREVLAAKEEAGAERADVDEAMQAHMLNMDPPDHTRLRKLVVKAFTMRRVEMLRPRVERIAQDLLDDMADRVAAGRSEVDLLDVFAFPLPIRVICELLGVPEQRRGEFRVWSNALVAGDDPRAAERASIEMTTYLRELIEYKRRNPTDDLLGGLLEASDEQDRLDGDELIGMIFLLLVAGHETTVNLIGNGVLSLLRSPEQFALLRDDPDQASAVVEETLRYDGPVNLATLRYTIEAVSIGDAQIPEGELVLVALSSANRDETRYPEPDSFEQRRDTSGHLGFGHGIHFCVGAPLARMEGEIALRGLVRRFPELSMAVADEELRWRFSTLMRGLERLPVRLG